MTDSAWRKTGAWGAIAFVILQLVGQSLIQIGGAEPAFNAGAGEIMEFFEARNVALFNAGGYLSIVSMIAFLWFLGGLWATLREAEGSPAWLSLVAGGSGAVGVAVVSAGGAAWGLAVFRLEEGLDPAMARLLFDQGNLAFANFWVFLAGLLLATAVVVLRRGGLPRWLGWFAAAAAVALLVGRAFWASPSGMIFVPYMLFWIWLIATGVAMLRRRDAIPAAPS